MAITVSRTNQDYRYDRPGVGPKTLEKLIEGGASVLAVEANCVMIVDQAGLVEMAEGAGVSIICG